MALSIGLSLMAIGSSGRTGASERARRVPDRAAISGVERVAADNRESSPPSSTSRITPRRSSWSGYVQRGSADERGGRRRATGPLPGGGCSPSHGLQRRVGAAHRRPFTAMLPGKGVGTGQVGRDKLSAER